MEETIKLFYFSTWKNPSIHYQINKQIWQQKKLIKSNKGSNLYEFQVDAKNA